MDIPLNGISGSTDLNQNWIFLPFPIAVADLTSGSYTTGLPGVVVDTRTSSQPQYSNNKALDGTGGAVTRDTGAGAPADVDNTSLSAPNAPVLFLADKADSTHLDVFIRLSTADVTDGRIGIFLRKVLTNEDCDQPDAYRWVFCSALILPG